MAAFDGVSLFDALPYTLYRIQWSSSVDSLVLSATSLARTDKVRVLSSWKEIAIYLNRGVRTVQRWERDYGLPVHRPKSTLKGSVFALKDELDVWMRDAPYRDKDTDDPIALAEQIRDMEAECNRLREKLKCLKAI